MTRDSDGGGNGNGNGTGTGRSHFYSVASAKERLDSTTRVEAYNTPIPEMKRPRPAAPSTIDEIH